MEDDDILILAAILYVIVLLAFMLWIGLCPNTA
jgi:hypothetical protein